MTGRRMLRKCLPLLCICLAPSLVAAQPAIGGADAGLSARDTGTRLNAVRRIRDANGPDAARQLSVALRDRDDRVRLEAIEAELSLFTTTQPIVRKKMV